MPDPLTCSEFLEFYSEYRDGLVGEAALRRRIERHLDQCPRCARYDRRISRGVNTLRQLGQLEPSPLFRRELADHLATLAPADELTVAPAPAGLMVGLMLAAAVMFLLWEVAAGSHGGVTASAPTPTLPPPPPPPVVVANPGVPFVSFTDLTVPAFGAEWHAPGAAAHPIGDLRTAARR